MEALVQVSPSVAEVVEVKEKPKCNSEVAMTIVIMLQLTLESTYQPTSMIIDPIIAELVSEPMAQLASINQLMYKLLRRESKLQHQQHQ
jgi:phosphoribosylformylglycinamidine (FGAM) synthase-like enzyme